MNDEQFVDIKYVRNNPNIAWNKHYLSYNPILTVKDIDTLVLPNSEGEWNWYFISKYINIQDVRNNPDKTWSNLGLSANKTLTVEDVETLRLSNSYGDWDWEWISRYINIREVINNPNRLWDRNELKSNNGVTDKILEFFDAGLLKHLQKNIYTFKYHTDMIIKCEY